MKKKKNVLRRLIGVAMLVCMLMLAQIPVFATTEKANVQSAKNAVVEVVVGFRDNNQVKHDLYSGTGFLINETTVITCEHVTSFDYEDAIFVGSDDYEGIFKDFNMDQKKIEENKYVEISVIRDVRYTATVKNASAEMDLAILQMTDTIGGRTYLPIRDSSTVQTTENCYAIGFPGLVSDIDNVNTYTADDVTVTDGAVSKVSNLNINGSHKIDCIVSTANLESGNSGGPLVDEDGNVIGIAEMQTGSLSTVDGESVYVDEGYNYYIGSEHLLSMLDPLGVEYTPAGETPPVVDPTVTVSSSVVEEPVSLDKADLDSAIEAAEDVEGDKDSYKQDDAWDAFEDELSAAKEIQAKNDDISQADVDDAVKALTKAQDSLTPAPEPLPITLIIGIAAAVLIIIIIIIILVSKGKKKDNGSAYNPGPAFDSNPRPDAMPNVEPMAPVAPAEDMFMNYQGGAGTEVLGANETTVLNAGSGETTVLNKNESYGTLTSEKTHEVIKITNASFKIGRERSSVDYCISGNTAVGRVHAVISQRGDGAYITDKNSKNGTFVNKVKVAANVDTKLNSGDKIEFADEEYTYNAF